MTVLSPFEENIREQPDALAQLARSRPARRLPEIAAEPWDRIVLTGMGSSHTVGLPTWRALAATGRPVWNLDAGQLLDTPGMVTPNTLVVATSQSGASGEIVELLERGVTGRALVGITARDDSPLAQAADLYLPLHSGAEATVSTKSYLNSLAVHHYLAGAFHAMDTDRIEAQLAVAPRRIAGLVDLDLTEIAQRALEPRRPRLVTVGWADAAATALFAGLIVKESSKMPIEGFIGGEFRHGPYELAGPGLTAILFGASQADDGGSLARIAQDLIASGAQVVLVGDLHMDGATTIDAAADGTLLSLLEQSVVAERLAVAMAQENGVVPGAFAYGSKVTATL